MMLSLIHTNEFQCVSANWHLAVVPVLFNSRILHRGKENLATSHLPLPASILHLLCAYKHFIFLYPISARGKGHTAERRYSCPNWRESTAPQTQPSIRSQNIHMGRAISQPLTTLPSDLAARPRAQGGDPSSESVLLGWCFQPGDPTEENSKYFTWQMLVGAHQSLVWCGGTETCLGSWLQPPPTAQQAAVGSVQRPQQCPCGAEHLSALCWGEHCPPLCWYHQERQGCECGTARSLPVALVYHLVTLVLAPSRC